MLNPDSQKKRIRLPIGLLAALLAIASVGALVWLAIDLTHRREGWESSGTELLLVVVIALEGIIAYAAFFRDQAELNATHRQEMINACFRMLDIWSSKYYRKCRYDGWYKLQQIKGKLDINNSYERDHDLVGQLWTIAHFLGNLQSLLENDLVEKHLASVLFKEDAEFWIREFEQKIDWGRSQDFFGKRIKPLPSDLILDGKT